MTAAQLELGAAPDLPIGKDPFAELRARFPTARLLLLIDRRPGLEGTIYQAIAERGSRWYDLLPPEQIALILPAS